MSRQRPEKDYDVYYGYNDNAALEPEYIPRKKPRTETAAQRRERKKQAKAARKAELSRYAILTVLTVAVAAMGFFVVARNAQVYSNTQTIRSLAKEKQNIEIRINDVKKDYSEGSELNTYFDIAQNRLELSYPEDDMIITVMCAGETQDDVSASEKHSDIFDKVVDWLSDFERRIKIWQ